MSHEKIKILFVDDEEMLLQGLRRMLRGMRGEWTMAFAPGPKEALEHLESNPVDVVVSDMRMPEMTGAELLREVSCRFPDTVRIVLSGYAENETVMKTVGPSHQYMAKPCDADELIKTIKRSLKLRRYLAAPRLKAFVTGLTALPILPDVYTAFMDEIVKSSATTDSIASVIEQDIGLTATILKMTNSAYFSLPTRIVNCRQAVQFLGLETMRSLVAVAGLFEPGDKNDATAPILFKLRDRSLATASLAREIALGEGLSSTEAELACCAGLMHNLGYLLLLASDEIDAYALEEILDHEPSFALDIERERFGTTHAEVAAYLLSLWGFADPVIEAVLHHHGPHGEGISSFDATAALHIAQALVSARPAGPVNRDERIPAIDKEFIETLGKADCIDAWLKLEAKQFEKGAMI